MKLRQEASEEEEARLRGKIYELEAHNLWLDGELLDKEDKLKYFRVVKLVELLEENQNLQAQIASLATAEKDLENMGNALAEKSKTAEQVPGLMAKAEDDKGKDVVDLAEAKKLSDSAMLKVVDAAKFGF